MTGWIAALEPGAPDVVGAWRGIEEERFLTVRREVRRRAGPGSAERIVPQLAVLAEALIAMIGTLPDEAFGLPGGEEDWTVAETIGHDASRAPGSSWPRRWRPPADGRPDAPRVVPGVSRDRPGSIATDLVRKIEQSQRIIARSARRIAGHETEPCLLAHPLVGRLRCGEWLLFAGVHDLMHLEQLHAIADRPRRRTRREITTTRSLDLTTSLDVRGGASRHRVAIGTSSSPKGTRHVSSSTPPTRSPSSSRSAAARPPRTSSWPAAGQPGTRASRWARPSIASRR